MFNKFKSLFKSNQTTPLYSSGDVLRNYANEPRFDPHRQVVGITYKAIDKIGQSLSDYELRVRRPNSEDFLTNHPLYNLYKKPNTKQTASDFIHLYGMLYEIYGETFWYIARGDKSNKPKELYLLTPNKVELKTYQGELVGYVLHKDNGTQVPLLLEDVIHDKSPNPFNEWRGMSVLERAAAYIDTEINITNFTLNYIKNNASPSGIVSLPDMDKEAFKQFAQKWREGYEGPQNAGKTAFIRGGAADFKAVGATLKEVDAKAIRDLSKNDVLMMLDVPKPLLGATDDVGFGRGNVETLYYIFNSEKIEPMMKRLDRIYEKIAVQMDSAPIVVSHTSPIPEDKEYNLQMYEKGANVWLTVNEIRSQMKLEPIKGGDELIPKEQPVAATQQTKTITLAKKIQPSKSEVEKTVRDNKESFREKLMTTSDIYADKLIARLSKFLNGQEDSIINKISTSKKAYEEWLFSIKDESEAMAEIMSPLIIELMEAQIEDVTNFISGQLITVTTEQRAAVEVSMKQLSGLFNQDTITALEKTLSEGINAGESLAKLKRRVEQTYSDAKGYRAERIARTESLKATNRTAEEVYKQNGYKSVEWFVNPGACEFCRVMAGRSRSIGSHYLNAGDVLTGVDGNQLKIDYETVVTPPLHPNCKCDIIPSD